MKIVKRCLADLAVALHPFLCISYVYIYTVHVYIYIFMIYQ